jgi:hypothetical protein
MRNQDIDSRNSREIHTEDTVQMLAQIEGRSLLYSFFRRTFGGGNGLTSTSILASN